MPKILLAVPRHPWPPLRGDQARALQVAELLSAAHEVTLLAPGPGEGGRPVPGGLPYRVETYAQATPGGSAWGLARALVEGLPLQAGLFRNRALGAALRRLAPASDLAILQLARLAGHRPDAAGAPLLVDLVDSLALSTARRAALDRLPVRPPLRLEARRLERLERRLVEQSAGALVVSDRDRRAVADGLPAEVAARLRVVPLAVPAGGGAAADPGGHRAEEPGPPVLGITGNLGYFPTREGLSWFLRSVWPELRGRRPDLRLLAAGARPGPGLRRALRAAGAELEVEPPDLAPALSRITVALAPMRGGAGQPMKILEAWAAGVPVVATRWAAAGTTGRPGEDLLVADEPEEWCRAVLDLAGDAARRGRIAASARARLEADYSVETVSRRLGEAVEAALGPPGDLRAGP